jgi:L-alanine-DL-glutamate epimerase-like enolase superfamily enzyme
MAARAFPWPLEEPRLAAEPLKRAGDIIEVPQRPGLGLEVDRSMRERYSIATGDVTR